MKRTILFLTLVVICLSISAQEWGMIRYAKSNVNIRSKRSTNSKVIGKLSKGEEVKVDFLQDNWFAVFKPNENIRDQSRSMGFVYSPLLLPNKPSDFSENSQPTTYKTIEKQDVSYLGKSRMVYRIIIQSNKLPSEQELKEISNAIWKKGNTKWDEFTVFSYMPGMNTGSTAYSVAEFRPSGMIDFNINDYALIGTKWEK